MVTNKMASVPIFAFLVAIHMEPAWAPPDCKGPNKNNPGCEPPAEEVLPAATLENVSVDWFNQKLILRGTGLLGVTTFTVGSSAALTTGAAADTEVDIPFDVTLAAAVGMAGNYQLKLDGSDVLSVYFLASVLDPAAGGCPCEDGNEWSTALGALWGPQDTACLEITGPGSNDQADIAGEVLTDPNDPLVFPHYFIGASFIPGDPVSSTCRLVEFASDAAQTELVKHRVNESQQANCAALLQANICQAP